MAEVKFGTTTIYSFDKITDQNFYSIIHSLPTQQRQKKRGNKGTKHKLPEYVDVITSFDIETTRVHDYSAKTLSDARAYNVSIPDYTVMYIWQWAFTFKNAKGSYDTICVYGRRWHEYQLFKSLLTASLGDNVYIVVYDHNLAYEFQFLRGILPFSSDDVFNIKPRQPLKALSGHLEFRCSYKQTNMSLRKFAESMQTPHQKTELDYTEKRFWYTPLTDKEVEYAVNDVICLNEAMLTRMAKEGDDLYTVPLTSTGYVRREVKAAVSSDKRLLHSIRDMMPDYYTYTMLKEAFRGGNTHANRYYSNRIIESKDYGMIHSADRSSSYPAVICNCEYPMEAFAFMNRPTYDKVRHYMADLHMALLMRVRMKDVRLRDPGWGCPYLSVSKCRDVQEPLLDNGRIVACDYLETTITDVDLQIIIDEYDAKIDFIEVAYAKYGKLPRPIIDEVIKYYTKKTSLKGVKGSEYYYMKNKNLLNSIYGMMVQDLVKILCLYTDGDEDGSAGTFVDDTEKTPDEILIKAEKRGFLNYAWGVWVTAWARYELERGIRLAGDGFLYCDTDSVKYVGDVDWEEYNKEKIQESLLSGSHAVDPSGTEHYMGVFEPEHDMEAFKTMGAKKYAYVEDGQLHITIAGVGKSAGVKEMETKAEQEGCRPIDEFREGFTFEGEAGGLEAVYNDIPLGDTVADTAPDDLPLRVISNVTLRPSTYTLGLTDEYRRIIEGVNYSSMDDII